ncbi:class I SAM-dependent methyltransferase [Neoroseomonas soli]|uniref:Methyltransferase domain-containing protein n=1 Tax=Neoroseomonas soli TaxID=1081025 RepID=A0A9X9X3V0_9PROT|nr:class I SAM-dependent methyltransferase [Neoroseomonas soli]MBR0674079.1 methyltransferase domain-containing protein [Neoroseomonas soli]
MRARHGAADARYFAAYQRDAAPPRMHLALAVADTVWAPADRDRLAVLDIGCGRGVTACLLAAANPGWDVIGLDFQPAHVAEAREMEAEAGLANARFIEADLAEFDEDKAASLLPEVDAVICNGVWTWVPDAVRAGILRLLRARMKPGGILFMGYNALPGFADCIALQRLLEEAARGEPGGEAERGAAALAAVEALRAAGAKHLPPDAVLDHILMRGRRNPATLAHEWLTPFWRPVFHGDLARDLARVGLEYGGYARPEHGQAELNLTPEQQAAMGAAPPGFARETLLDTLLNRRFRTDIFVRGRRTGARRSLPGVRVTLAAAPEASRVVLQTQSGQAELPDEQSAAIIERLARSPATLGELAALPGNEDLNPLDLAVMLVHSGFAHPLWRDPAADAGAKARAARCNAVLLHRLGRDAVAIDAPLGAAVPGLGCAVQMSAAELAVAVVLQEGSAPDAAALAARLADPEGGPEALEGARAGIADVLAQRLAAWRMMGLA